MTSGGKWAPLKLIAIVASLMMHHRSQGRIIPQIASKKNCDTTQRLTVSPILMLSQSRLTSRPPLNNKKKATGCAGGFLFSYDIQVTDLEDKKPTAFQLSAFID
jgi:hypothetical protein